MFSLFLAGVLGGILGVTTAGRFRGAGVLRVVTLSGASAPQFLLAELGILFFYRHLHWLPATGRSGLATPPNGPTGFLSIDTLVHG